MLTDHMNNATHWPTPGQPANVASCGNTLRHSASTRLAQAAATTAQRSANPRCDLDSPLTLELLATQHAAAFCEQYRDPHIAALTLQEYLATPEQVQHWIKLQATLPGQLHFAVMHAEHGFVGSLGLTVAAGYGYFSFWIGTDHQGKGLGPRAAQLLMQSHWVAGLHGLYTSAFNCNLRSRRILALLGWLPLQIQALPPDQDLLFFHHPVTASAYAPDPARLHRGLVQLCASTQSTFVFAPPS